MEYGSTECSEQHVPTVMLQGYGGFYDFQGTETLSWAILSHVKYKWPFLLHGGEDSQEPCSMFSRRVLIHGR
jgi:hypothetical protein